MARRAATRPAPPGLSAPAPPRRDTPRTNRCQCHHGHAGGLPEAWSRADERIKHNRGADLVTGAAARRLPVGSCLRATSPVVSAKVAPCFPLALYGIAPDQAPTAAPRSLPPCYPLPGRLARTTHAMGRRPCEETTLYQRGGRRQSARGAKTVRRSATPASVAALRFNRCPPRAAQTLSASFREASTEPFGPRVCPKAPPFVACQEYWLP